MYNERCFHLMVTRFAVVYICSTADVHENTIMIFLIDWHILLTFLGGKKKEEKKRRKKKKKAGTLRTLSDVLSQTF